jgi:hypothetical protein
MSNGPTNLTWDEGGATSATLDAGGCAHNCRSLDPTNIANGKGDRSCQDESVASPRYSLLPSPHILGNMEAVDLNDEQIELIEIAAGPGLYALCDSATNRRDAADFEVPSPSTRGSGPSGSRTARPILRVATPISTRFIAVFANQCSVAAAVHR